MRTLVIDTATSACSVALFEDGHIIAAHYEVIARGHAERLVPFIDNLPNKGRADYIAVNTGPGSFTGIRVGISAARALAFAWDVPCKGYGCLDLVGAMAIASAEMPSEVDVIMNGGHGEYFFQQFDINGRPLAEPLSMPLDMAANLSNAPVVSGDAAKLLTNMCGNRTAFDYLPDARQWHLIAGHTPLPSSPFYGRAPDAKLPGNIVA
jgi:tRNA threonylcarbamoyladenosine biosynthesis protein TsaB